MTLPLPCNDDDRFIDDSLKVMREVAPMCFVCPVFDACWESHKGEPWGVIAGTVPGDELRVAALKAGKPKTVCRNGHPTELYGTRWVEDGQLPSIEKMAAGCRRCADITRWMADEDRPEVCPDTAPNPEVDETEYVPGSQKTRRSRVPIVHGTAAGYKAHWRRNEKACAPCLKAHAESKATARASA